MYCYLWIYSGIGASVVHAWPQVPKVTRLPLIETVIGVVEEMAKVPVPHERHVSPQHSVVCFCFACTSYKTAVSVCVAPYGVSRRLGMETAAVRPLKVMRRKKSFRIG